MIKWLTKFMKSLHEEGVFVPLVRDGRVPSVSLTLLFISSLFVIFGLLKVFSVSFWESLSWYITCSVLYYNRSAKISKEGFEINSNKE